MRYWMGMANRQAVANRLKIVVALLADAFTQFAGEPEVRILSVASGSAQAVIGAMARCPQLNMRAMLLDNDETAIEEARRNACQAGMHSRLSRFSATTALFGRRCTDPMGRARSPTSKCWMTRQAGLHTTGGRPACCS